MIYLDNNASMELYPEAIDGLVKSLEHNVNAGSAHIMGRKAHLSIESARENIAKLVGAKSEEVLFVSGATEANNIAMLGCGEKLALVSSMEHPSILQVHPNTEVIPVNFDGVVDLEWLENRLKQENAGDVIVSVMYSSHDTGVIQPVKEISKIVKKYSQRYHLDAVQGAGKVNINFADLDVDSISIASHKIGGSQGIGALVYKQDCPMKMILKGGGQEKRRRPGTPNLGAIISFGIAAKICISTLEEKTRKLNFLRTKLETKIQELHPEVLVVSSNVERLPGTSRLILPKAFSGKQVIFLDMEGFCVSAGAVCSQGVIKVPFSLLSMGYDKEEQANCSIRIGMSWNTTEQEIDQFIAIYDKMANSFK